MTFLSQFIKYEIIIILTGLLVFALIQIFRGPINILQMLRDKKTHALSSARIQQFLFTIIIAVFYIYQSIKNPAVFPELDQSILYIFSASSIAYLGGKARTIRWFLGKIYKKK